MTPFWLIGVIMLSSSLFVPHERTAKAIAITGLTCLILALILTL